MRTTLTLDDDVAAALERLRESSDKPLKDVVNAALRLGLQAMETKPNRSTPFRTQTVDLGECRFTSLDNVADVIAVTEGDAYK